jgi:uncharacterized membrane protein (DUF485 family)
LAQHEVTGSAGRTPRQGQEYDWWSVSGMAGSPDTDQQSSGFPGEPVHELMHDLIHEPIHEFMHEPDREFLQESVPEFLDESDHGPVHTARSDSQLAGQAGGHGGRSQRTGSTAFADADRSARSLRLPEDDDAASVIPGQRPSGTPGSPAGPLEEQDPVAAEVYREVQQSPAFQEIRRNHRRFVFPATAVFVCWYLFYVTVLAAAPGLMRTQLAGPFSVAWLLGLLQFASTFLITWLYARNARTKRDRAALGLRWDTQDQLR